MNAQSTGARHFMSTRQIAVRDDVSMSRFEIRNARIFTGNEVIEDCIVRVEDGWIIAVGTDAAEGVEVVDGAGATLLPGLIDDGFMVTASTEGAIA
jgi:adenine deaminase